MDLKSIKIYELVEELEKREGVKKTWAEPYRTKDNLAEGPAVILVITD